jgi:predicted nicotinamide N-methyase
MINCNDTEEELIYQEEKIGPYSFFLKVAEDDFNAEKKTLFATVIWFGARTLSSYLTVDKKEKIKGRSVIELGAGMLLNNINT